MVRADGDGGRGLCKEGSGGVEDGCAKHDVGMYVCVCGRNGVKRKGKRKTQGRSADKIEEETDRRETDRGGNGGALLTLHPHDSPRQ